MSYFFMTHNTIGTFGPVYRYDTAQILLTRPLPRGEFPRNRYLYEEAVILSFFFRLTFRSYKIENRMQRCAIVMNLVLWKTYQLQSH